MNKKIVIIGVSLLILAVAISSIIWFRSRRANQPQTIANPTMGSSLSIKQSSANQILADGNEVFVSSTNKIIVKRGGSEVHTLSLGNISAPESTIIFSPSQQYAIGRISTDQATAALYFFSDVNAPQPLGSSIIEVAMVNNDGSLVYHAEDQKGGVIAVGGIHRENERVLTPVTNLYIGFAALDQNHILDWGQPTAPGGSNLYQVEISSGKSTKAIGDETVVDAALSPSKKVLLVSRYNNNKTSVWLYSLGQNKFLKDLGADFLLSPIAWNKDESAVAYWDGATIKVINLANGAISSVGAVDNLQNGVTPPLSWGGNIITVYAQ